MAKALETQSHLDGEVCLPLHKRYGKFACTVDKYPDFERLENITHEPLPFGIPYICGSSLQDGVFTSSIP